jgi:hypothetical protein
VQRTVEIDLASWRVAKRQRAEAGGRRFVTTLLLCVLAAAALASWLPLQVSIVTVLLFAGPHNWFELRYFLMRLPARFGRSRHFFLTAFIGLGFLAVTYVSLPIVFQRGAWSNETWLIVLAVWNTLLLSWVGILSLLRARQKSKADWRLIIPILLGIAALNWLGPEFFSLALVYAHPLVALWFLDRQLARRRPRWVTAYRRCLCLLPLLLAVMIWQLSQTPALADDNGLFWRITQHSGAQLLPQLSSHLLVSVHLFLEMLHYGVWLVALPLLGPRFWNLNSKPKSRPRKTILVIGVAVIVVLWVGFGVDYTTTRDLYFTIAIAHVLAEAPFLLRML